MSARATIRSNLISAGLGLAGMVVGAIVLVIVVMSAFFYFGGPNVTGHSTAFLLLPLAIVGGIGGLAGGVALALRIVERLDRGARNIANEK